MKSSKMLAQNAFFKMKSTWAKDIDKKISERSLTTVCKGVRCPPIFSLSNLINAGWLVTMCINIHISFNCWH